MAVLLTYVSLIFADPVVALGRLIVIGLAMYMTWKGRRWARLLLGVFVVAAAFAVAVGAVNVGLGTIYGIIGLALAFAYAAPYLYMVRSVHAQAFFVTQQSSSAKTERSPLGGNER